MHDRGERQGEGLEHTLIVFGAERIDRKTIIRLAIITRALDHFDAASPLCSPLAITAASPRASPNKTQTPCFVFAT